MNSIFHRISVRKYEDKPVEKEKIMQILKAGMQAPSACNQRKSRNCFAPLWRLLLPEISSRGNFMW